jgi:6-phosphogluconolactonase (cycloisomerase 2 family)
MKNHRQSGIHAVTFVGILLAFVPALVAQQVKLSAASLNFGTVALGQVSNPVTVTLSNPDAVHPLGFAIAASGDYSESDACAGIVAPSGTCALTITFKPTTAAVINGTVTLRDDASNSPHLISATGRGIAPVTASSAAVAFGTVGVGSTSAAKTVTFTNNSTVTATLGVVSSGDYVVADAGTTPCTASLTSKSSCQISVKFKPTISGAINGAVTITQNINSTPQLIALFGTGSGGAAPPLSFSPATLAFGAVGVGASSSATAITVTNKGSKTVTISSFKASGDYKAVAGAVTPCGGALPAGKQCKIAVTFIPTLVGTIKGALTISDNNASVGTQILDLSGQGTARLTVSPASLTFATQPTGILTQQLITLTNGLKTSISITGVGVSGQYTLLKQCGATLAPAASCTLGVTFAPTKAGTIRGELTINANVKLSPIVVPLSGTAAGALPRFAYVPNFGDATVSMYTVNFRTGQLRPNGYVMSGAGPTSVALHPTGQFAYVTNQGDNTISAYKVNPSRGTLSPIAGSPFPTGSGPQGLTFDPSGRFAYAVNNIDNTISAYVVNFANGVLEPVSGSPFSTGNYPSFVVVESSGKYAYITNGNDSTVSAYSIDGTTGALTPVSGSPFPTGTFPYAITADPSGKFLYVTNVADSTVSAFVISSSTGGLTAIAGSPFPTGSFPLALTMDNTGKYLFVANTASSNVSAYSVNSGSGALTAVSGSPFSIPLEPHGLTVDTTNQYLYVTEGQGTGGGNVVTFSLNPATGGLALLLTVTARVEPQAIGLVSGANPVRYTPTFAFTLSDPGTTAAGKLLDYAIEPLTGALTLGSNPGSPTEIEPTSVALDPTGRFAYVSNEGSNDISCFSISPTTGAPTPLPGSARVLTENPFGVAVDSSGRFLFVLGTSSHTAAITTYTINVTTGVPTPAGDSSSLGFGLYSITLDPSGRFLYSTDASQMIHALSINPSTGALSQVGPPFALPKVISMAVEASGRFLYAGDINNAGLHAFAIGTSGALTELPDSPYAVGTGRSVATDPSGHYVYVVDAEGLAVNAFSINVTTGGSLPWLVRPFRPGPRLQI